MGHSHLVLALLTRESLIALLISTLESRSCVSLLERLTYSLSKSCLPGPPSHPSSLSPMNICCPGLCVMLLACPHTLLFLNINLCFMHQCCSEETTLRHCEQTPLNLPHTQHNSESTVGALKGNQACWLTLLGSSGSKPPKH